MKGVVHDKGHPGEVAQVLQQGKQGEEDGHGGQHHRHHPGCDPVHPVQQQAAQPGRGGGQPDLQHRAQPGKQFGEQGGGHVGPRHRQPHHQSEQQQQQRDAGGLRGKQPVQFLLAARAARLPAAHRPGGAALRQCDPLGRGVRLSGGSVRSDKRGNGLPEGVQSLLPPGGNACHRHAQLFGQGVQIHLDPQPPGLVHEVDAHQRPARQLQHLERQDQAALQTGGVAHHHHRVRLSALDVIPGHRLLLRVSRQGICPRQVDELVFLPLERILSFGGGHRLARPVSRVLAQSGQRVEQGGLPHVGIARQRHPVHVATARTGCSRTCRSMCTPSASARRRAMSAPRMR